ncbi:MAG: general secretion pathway protein GspD [Burkholderiales bacterium]|nr:MAG: general secretion pathway protein GspD [Burkholderiales bacterium]
MNIKNQTRFASMMGSISLVLLLAACASPAIKEAGEMGRVGRYEEGLDRLKQALADDPDNRELRVATFKLQDEAVSALSHQAMLARSAGKPDEVAQLLKRMEAVAPQHPRTASLRLEVERTKRLEHMMSDAQQAFDNKAYEPAEATLRALVAEDGSNRRAKELLARIDDLRAQQTRRQSTVTLGASQKPITLEFHEAPIKNVFEALARAANINFVFDKDVRGDAKVTLFLKNTTVDEAMRVILGTQQMGYKLLNDNTVMVFPATQQKQRDLLDTVTRTFYLTNADTKQAQALIRTVAKTRDVFADDRLNMIVVRDTPEVVRMIERLIQGLDIPDPEVMLDLEVIEVSSKALDQIGISWPDTVNYGVPDATSPVTLSAPVSSYMHAYITNPLAIATLKSTRGATNILANPKIRARNREKAKVLLGEKLPVFTTTSTANVGVSASVSYLDVGLKLEVEPQVQLDNDVTVKLALEVSSVTDKVIGPQGSLAYQIGTREATTTLRLKDGETQILAGLINDNESRSSAGVPGLHELPIAGHLFGTTTDSKDKTEVVLLVTPHIVRNVVQPASAVSLMPSGTETQPGSVSMSLRDEATASGASSGVAVQGGARANGVSAPSKPTAPQSINEVRVTGPEEVMPGSAFQVMVRNPKAQALSVNVMIDTNHVEVVGQNMQSASSVSVSVPPQGMVPVMLRAKTGAAGLETNIHLDVPSEALIVKIRNPADPDQASDAGAMNTDGEKDKEEAEPGAQPR